MNISCKRLGAFRFVEGRGNKKRAVGGARSELWGVILGGSKRNRRWLFNKATTVPDTDATFSLVPNLSKLM